MNKRSFFKSLASIVATVALAPEICFRTKLDKVVAPEPFKMVEFWEQTERYSHYYSQDYIDFMTDRATADKIRNALSQYQGSQPSSPSKAQNS